MMLWFFLHAYGLRGMIWHCGIMDYVGTWICGLPTTVELT